MQEPSLRTSRLVILGGLAAAAALSAFGFLLGRETALERGSADLRPAPAPPPQAVPVEQPRTLLRSDIIALAGRQADVLVGGAQPRFEAPGLVGRHVDLVIPFGCDGPAPADSRQSPRWRYDPSSKTLRIHVAPQIWTEADWGASPSAGAPTPSSASASSSPDLRQGFWVTYPWTSRETCPAGAAPAEDEPRPGVPMAETLAVVQDLGSGADTPKGPFEVVKRIAPDQLDLAQGFRIRVKGRIAAWPDGNAVRCLQREGNQQRPVCLVAMEFDEISVENPGPVGSLATWSVGRPAAAE